MNTHRTIPARLVHCRRHIGRTLLSLASKQMRRQSKRRCHEPSKTSAIAKLAHLDPPGLYLSNSNTTSYASRCDSLQDGIQNYQTSAFGDTPKGLINTLTSIEPGPFQMTLRPEVFGCPQSGVQSPEIMKRVPAGFFGGCIALYARPEFLLLKLNKVVGRDL